MFTGSWWFANIFYTVLLFKIILKNTLIISSTVNMKMFKLYKKKTIAEYFSSEGHEYLT